MSVSDKTLLILFIFFRCVIIVVVIIIIIIIIIVCVIKRYIAGLLAITLMITSFSNTNVYQYASILPVLRPISTPNFRPTHVT